jgi:hypothetical protein
MNIRLILGIALSVATFGAAAGDGGNSVHEGNCQNITVTKVASHDQAVQMASDILIKDAARRHAIAQATAPIRSRGDLDQYLFTHKTIASPLDAFSPSLRQMFLSSLTFNEKGITGFRYDVLESLTPTEIYKILSLFGAQGFTPQLTNVRIVTPTDNLIMSPPSGGVIGIGFDFLKDYRCQSRGTCHVDNMAACTSNC